MKYQETIDYLYALQWHGIKLGLDNPRELLRRLGNPETDMQFAHIAGTNGKGSTASMLSALMTAAGHRCGLFTSPHLLSFTERISVDGIHITEQEVVELAHEIKNASEGLKPTFFEVVTAMAFMHFKRKEADFCVIETGMGGRLDATNVIEPRVAIITPIGLDHAEFLGTTLQEVATEKAGIIKPGRPVICAKQHPEVMEVIHATAAERGSSLHMEGREFGPENIKRNIVGVVFDYHCGAGSLGAIRVPLRGAYQAANASLAIRAYELINRRIDETAVREALSSLRWPGRLEFVADNPPTFVDGAHNPPAAAALAAELMAEGAGGDLTLVIGVMSDKDAEGIIHPLLPLARQVIFTRAGYGRAAEPASLAQIARRMGFAGPIAEAATVAEALKMARLSSDSIVVTGSLYTAGEALETLGAKSTLGTLRESAPDSKDADKSSAPESAR